jgi:hypothetical protein
MGTRARRARCIDEGTGKAYMNAMAAARAGTVRPEGVHFIGLACVVNPKAGGIGRLGDEQLAACRSQGQEHLHADRRLCAHPLWTVAPEWGWGTEDSAKALALLARFGSVTCSTATSIS